MKPLLAEHIPYLIKLLERYKTSLDTSYNNIPCKGYNQGLQLWDNRYPRMYFNGEDYRVSRVVCFIHHGLDILNTSILALHRCDNTFCIEEQHLFVGSQRDNMLDRISKGNVYNKTYCKYGHELTHTNLYYRKNGKRQCATCCKQRAAKSVKGRKIASNI